MKTVLAYIRQALGALAGIPASPHAVAIGAQLKACASNAEAHIANELATEAAKAAAAIATPTLAELQAANDALQAKLNALAPPAPPAQPSSSEPFSAPVPTGSKTDKGQSAKGQSAKGSLGALAALAALGALLFAHCANAQPTSFNVTNVITTNVVSGFPTNVQAYTTNAYFTNYIGQGTGGAVSVANNEFVLLSVSGYLCTNINPAATNQIVIDLTRSASANPPGVQTGTNFFTGNGTNFQSTDWDTWSNSVSPLSQIIVPLNLTTGYFRWSTNIPSAYVSAANWLGIGSIQLQETNQNAFITNFAISVAKKIIPIRYP